ncbi:hypothetical protein [Pseudomonas sp.]|uniref:hypothetical protein n=1 Tax=Pseudomonas sp. TaxID=306 RepID=UPI00261EC6FB|nr:hypothetical protein [Pseudomonas sp.]
MEVDRRNVKKYLIENLSSILGVDKNTLDLDASFDDFGDEAEYKIEVLQFLETVYDFEIDEEQGAEINTVRQAIEFVESSGVV